VQSFYLDATDLVGLQQYLHAKGRLPLHAKVLSLDSAGEGNMNLTLRVTTEAGTFILKQSRDHVVRYPSIPAPKGRILREAEFYRIVRTDAFLREHTPEVLWTDESNYLMALEDLGQSTDFSRIYRKGEFVSKQDIVSIAKVMSELHFRFNIHTTDEYIFNRNMRVLNHRHIFEIPLQEGNGVNLDTYCPGLQEATGHFRNDPELKAAAEQMGHVYLNDFGTALIHGDYYPGSWLNTANGFRVIDPEFCFFGPREFEMAVAVAHLKMAQQPDSIIKDLFIYYHFDQRFDGSLFTRFAGMEMIRRLIGVAQLPLELTLQERLEMLEQARVFVLQG
jgi:5-methylthioribose kinase